MTSRANYLGIGSVLAFAVVDGVEVDLLRVIRAGGCGEGLLVQLAGQQDHLCRSRARGRNLTRECQRMSGCYPYRGRRGDKQNLDPADVQRRTDCGAGYWQASCWRGNRTQF